MFANIEVTNPYVVLDNGPGNLIMSDLETGRAVFIQFDLITVQKAGDAAELYWSVRWADTVKGGWNDFGMVRTPRLCSAVTAICLLHKESK